MNMRKRNFISLYTITRKEVIRFLRIWMQTILPPAITTILYFAIFGTLIGPRIGKIEGLDYMQFIAPGLIMMSVINNSYANVVSSFYGARFQRSIEEILVSPTPNSFIIFGFVLGGVLRGLLVGIAVSIVAMFFTHFSIHHLFDMFSVVILSSALFALAGFTNSLFAKSFDDISVIPTFVLTPLTYFGGVFYSIKMLSPAWQTLSLANPILYMVNAFRFSILGVSDIPINHAYVILIAAVVALFGLNYFLMARGYGIRT